jgi:pimeloyl-ACP methyl ester carboxylesterase
MSLTNDTATYSEETFKCSDGIKIEYRDYESTSYLHRVPIICLHGLTRNLKDFEDVAPKIAALGFRTIVPSQRGRGRSDYDKTSANYNPEQYTSDMIELLDQLDISKAIFVGSSMGGIITMLLSMRQPNRVRAAILNDIGTELDPAGVSRIMG